MAVPTGRESDKFMLRLPDGMRDRIRALAERGNRSMNAETVLLIDQSLSFAEALEGAPPAGDGKWSLLVRLPADLGNRVKAASEENSRTLNAEIVATLEEKYPAPPDRQFNALLDWIEANVPKEEQTSFLRKTLERYIAEGRISLQDIDDGLVPGVEAHRGAE